MDKPLLEGWLHVIHQGANVWQRMYCKIVGQSFLISKQPNDKPEFDIKLNKETHLSSNSQLNPQTFTLSNTNTNTISFSSPELQKIESWIFATKSIVLSNANLSMDMFEIISVIGRGFYGKVMLCKRKDTNELFAIKSIHKNFLVERNKVAIAFTERNTLSMIKHPFIISLKFTFQSPSKVYFGLEYAPGGDLFYHLRNMKNFTLHDVRIYVAELALALDSLHKIGVVYRDMKPENIVLDELGHVKLVDFGFSKLINDDPTSTVCGSAEYLAPEVVERKSYGMEIDWWALGAIAYEMVYGSPPFTSDNKATLFSMIANAKIMFPNGSDPKVQAFIKGLLNRDPQKRFKLEDLKKCEFFADLNFDDVYHKKVSPIFVPVVINQTDTFNFAPEFTNEDPLDSDGAYVSDSSDFEGFSQSYFN